MFLLFLNLYMAMFSGVWRNYGMQTYISYLKPLFNDIGLFFTSIFGNNQMTTLGDAIFANSSDFPYFALIALVLATITSISIVIMAVKGIKKAFGIFFMGIRNI